MPQRTEVCFCSEIIVFKSAVNLAIEEQVSQAVESRKGVCNKVKQNIHRGLAAHLPTSGMC